MAFGRCFASDQRVLEIQLQAALDFVVVAGEERREPVHEPLQVAAVLST